jgi:hypothetical protein
MTTKPTYLARDDEGTAIQTLPCRAEGGWVIGIAATGASKLIGPFPARTRVVTIRAVGTAILFQPGVDNTVTVTVPSGDVDGGGPHYLPAGASIDVALIASQYETELVYLAVITAAATAGTVYVSERG